MRNRGLNILVIDDDLVDRMAICRHLSKTIFQVNIVEVGTAYQAKSYLSRESFDCVFLDFRLPDTDGLTLVKELRLSGNTLPIIVLTGQGDEQTAVELMKAGASDYLAKSKLSPDSLNRLIRHAMNAYRAEQRVRAAQEQLRQTNHLLKQQNEELESQRKQIERQNIRLQEANHYKSEFLATVSHELRTPLNSIMGFSQILKNQTKGSLNDYQLKMVNCVYTNGENLLDLVNDILDMSTLDANRLELSPHFFDLAVLIKELLVELQFLADEKNLEIRSSVCLHSNIVYSDRQRLKQILLNLLSNAIKFTDTGFVSLAVSTVAKNSIEIVVKDTGIGISQAQQATIFQPFRQGDQTIQRKYGGTGLGLAISHSLVTMMDGLITVDSELGQGSTFRLQIPRELSKSNAHQSNAEAPSQSAQRIRVESERF
ncbi:MAG: ATP-binding protein [Leptolyngbyaceae cyanobacterium]